MKNKDFFYLQYDKINWQNQEKTKINQVVNNFVIKDIILKAKGTDIAIFDIGFGIGFFEKQLLGTLIKKDKNIIIEGCEPSYKNYNYFITKNRNKIKGKIKLKTYNKTFLNIQTKTKFDFIIAIYVFPHFLEKELEKTIKKIYLMLKDNGKFILVIADENYISNKLKIWPDLFIASNTISLNGKKYNETVYYSDIPQIGKLVDCSREDAYYIELFMKNKFVLDTKQNLNETGYISTVFVFKKN